ncbi:MAG: MmgE/PrpD family protein [Dehalococcoidia bacterium]|nr:MmgE/PrpD family protein [Dehalococcoidia bacterium]
MDAMTEGISRYARGLDYEDIDPETVRQTKIRLIDSLACGLASYDYPVGRMVRAVAAGTDGNPGSTVIGTDHRSSPELAAFANSAMVRFLDCNDTYHSLDSGHPSDQLPGVLAAAEMAGADGKTVIAATVAAYEVYCGLCDVANISWGDSRWYNATWGPIASAAAVSRVLGLSQEQTGHAISIALASHASLGVITRGDQVPLWHACADPNAVRQGVFAALLAREGMDGPLDPFEGTYGFFDAISGPFPMPALGDGNGGFRLNNTIVKRYTTCSHTQTAAEAAVRIHGQLPQDVEIAEVLVTTNSYTNEVCGRPDRWRPNGHKTANLSLPYCIAVGLSEGGVGMDQFTEAKIHDPDIHAFMQRVRVQEDPEFSAAYPAQSMTAVEAIDKSGNRYSAKVGYTTGFPQEPIDEDGIETKFRDMTAHLITHDQQSRALEWLWSIEEKRDVGELFRHLVVSREG